MKKIILSLMMISSFLFSAVPSEYTSSASTFLPSNAIITYASGGAWNNPPFYSGSNYYNGYPAVGPFVKFNSFVSTANSFMKVSDCMGLSSTPYEIVCHTVVTFYYSFCPAGQVPNSTSSACVAPPPVCQLGQHNDPANTQNCIDDFPITSTETLASGSKLINYADGKMMLLRADGSAEMWDKNTGEFIMSNRAYNGLLPPSASFNPLSFNPSEPIQYKELTFGDFVAFEFNQAGIALKNVANVLAGAVALPIFMAISTNQQTPEGDLIKQSASSSAVRVDLTTVNFDNIDFSEYENTATSTPQTIPNTNIQVQKITTPANSSDPSNWASSTSAIKGFTGVASVGDTVSTSSSNPNTALITTPTDVKIASLKSDGSVEVVDIKKADLVNTATNNTPLPVEQVSIAPSKMLNDGTYSKSQTTTQSTVTPTNQNVDTGRISDIPKIIDYSPRTGLKDGNLYDSTTGAVVGQVGTSAPAGAPAGTSAPAGIPPIAPIIPAPAGGTGSIDLSGVTSRLDKISNQVTKINDFNEKLDNVKQAVVENPIDNSNHLLIISNFENSWKNIKNDFDRITTMTDEAKTTVENGFTFGFSNDSISECPYTTIFNYGQGSTDITIDLCKSVSPLRPIFYTIFNLFFQAVLIVFAFKSLLRLV